MGIVTIAASRERLTGLAPTSPGISSKALMSWPISWVDLVFPGGGPGRSGPDERVCGQANSRQFAVQANCVLLPALAGTARCQAA